MTLVISSTMLSKTNSSRYLCATLSLSLTLLLSSCTSVSDLANRPSYDRDTGSWSNFSGYKSSKKSSKSSSNKKASSNIKVPTSGGFTGHISYYGPGFHGKKTANGETYDQNDMTCAHKTLPFGTQLKITLLKTGKTVEVRVNDRGPYIKGRAVDVSVAAAKELGLTQLGVGEAQIEIIK